MTKTSVSIASFVCSRARLRTSDLGFAASARIRLRKFTALEIVTRKRGPPVPIAIGSCKKFRMGSWDRAAGGAPKTGLDPLGGLQLGLRNRRPPQNGGTNDGSTNASPQMPVKALAKSEELVGRFLRRIMSSQRIALCQSVGIWQFDRRARRFIARCRSSRRDVKIRAGSRRRGCPPRPASTPVGPSDRPWSPRIASKGGINDGFPDAVSPMPLKWLVNSAEFVGGPLRRTMVSNERIALYPVGRLLTMRSTRSAVHCAMPLAEAGCDGEAGYENPVFAYARAYAGAA
jgi:hypothetical protein